MIQYILSFIIYPDCDGGLVDIYSQCCPVQSVACDHINANALCRSNPENGMMMLQFTPDHTLDFPIQEPSVRMPTHMTMMEAQSAAAHLRMHMTTLLPAAMVVL